MTIPLEPPIPDAGWDAFVADHPLATYLQTAAWARVKAANGWTDRLIDLPAAGGGRIGARILLRRPRAVPWTFAYAPRGPLALPWDRDALEAFGAAVRAAAAGRDGPLAGVAHLRIDPEIEPGGERDPDGRSADLLHGLGWRPAPEVQPSVTRVIDLGPDEAVLWSDLRKKWRQYVNRARSRGVTVTEVDADADPSAFPTFHQVMTETARRTGTLIRTEAAYRDIWDAFRPEGVRLLFARDAGGTVQAVLLLVRCGTRVVEPYGGMTGAGADDRANYLLKWEAIRRSRDEGATSYDLWGLVHPGIRQFKEGFGGREVRLVGAWDLPLDRIGSSLYRFAEARRRPAKVPVASGPDEEAGTDEP